MDDPQPRNPPVFNQNIHSLEYQKMASVDTEIRRLLQHFDEITAISNNLVFHLFSKEMHRRAAIQEYASERETLVAFMIHSTQHLIKANQSLLKQGFPRAAQQLARSVFEHIHLIYAVMGSADFAQRYLRFTERIHKGESPNWRPFNPGPVRDLLYRKRDLPQIRKLYSGLSELTHPRIQGQVQAYSISKEPYIDAIHMGILFHNAFLAVVAEFYLDLLEDDEKSAVRNIIHSTAQRGIFPYSMIPSRKRLALRIKSWDEFEAVFNV